jgi:hypothetical protein
VVMPWASLRRTRPEDRQAGPLCACLTQALSQWHGLFENVTVAIAQTSRRHNMNRHAQHLSELMLSADQIEDRPPLVKIDKQVDVAVLSVVATGHRPKHTDIASTVTCAYVTRIDDQLVSGRPQQL